MKAVYGNVVFVRVFSFKIARASQKSHVFSVHFCSQLSPISCFVRFYCIFCISLCDSVLMCCSLWQAVPESSWSFNVILRCFLRTADGNVVFFRWNMDTHHKRLVFFRSLLLTAVANLMFCVNLFACFCTSVCDSVLMCCSLWQGVLESSWYVNAILRCFLRAVYGNRVFSLKRGCAS